MRTRRRAAVAALVMLCGIAIVAGAFLPWVDARGLRPASGIGHTSVTSLTHWSYLYTSSFVRSFALAVVVAGALVFLGGAAASRALTGLFSFLALAAAGLWIGLNAKYFSSVNLSYSDLRLGAWLAIGGALVALIFTFALRRRQQAAL